MLVGLGLDASHQYCGSSIDARFHHALPSKSRSRETVFVDLAATEHFGVWIFEKSSCPALARKCSPTMRTLLYGSAVTAVAADSVTATQF